MAAPPASPSPPPKRARLSSPSSSASSPRSRKNGDAPPLSLRFDGGGGSALSAASTLEELRRRLLHATTDPHLQARLLLAFGAAARAPAAHTESAIDFLFSFLQQNQQRGGGAGDADGATANANSTVVVGAIVRGLRALLAVKPRVVEPMIQLDAMAEQLTQCVSVAEDSKLRADMTRIVLDCLVLAGSAAAAVELLDVCVQDHDAGLRGVCLRGFLRLVDRGERLPAAVCARLETLLVRLLARSPVTDVRQQSARLLSALALTQPTVAAQPTALVLAAAARDPAAAVRVELALALRELGASLDGPDARSQLLLKTQISEALEDVDAQHVRMMASGALLTLLEDDDKQVAVEASRTILLWSEAGVSRDAVLRVVHAHVDAVVAHGRASPRDGALALLSGLGRLLALLQQQGGSEAYWLSSEEIQYLLSAVPSDDPRVLRAVCRVLSSLTLAHQRLVATSIVDMLTRLSTQSVAELMPSGREAFRRSVAGAVAAVGRCLAPGASTLPSPLMQRLKGAATAKDGLQYRAFCSRALLAALSSNSTDQSPSIAVRAGDSSSAELAASLAQTLRAIAARIRGRLEQMPPASQSLHALGAVERSLQELEKLTLEIDARCGSSLPRAAQRDVLEAMTLTRVARLIADRALPMSSVVERIKAAALEAPDDASAARLQQAVAPPDVRRDRLASVVVERLEQWRPTALLLAMDSGASRLRVASASIVAPLPLPSPSPSQEPREVASQLPLCLRVHCVLQNVASLTQVAVRAELPDGRIVLTPLSPERCRVHERHVAEGEAHVSVRVPAFSDPTQLWLSVCLRSSRQAATQDAALVPISPAVAVSIQHRALATSSRHNSRS
ncbi:hypothetical protein P43SY_006786 [Pythium insidiosum]|uniref:Integrator complex subunit 4/Protein SIEL C-terminal Ig-like domain-containing protein n=1 Tax=Pythium insidiosum TaxID=114742 RepID=A0AAD5LAM5_PYTIN|nr:hypothetical protein P43SY_006786 [Pythium insidiosum]